MFSLKFFGIPFFSLLFPAALHLHLYFHSKSVTNSLSLSLFSLSHLYQLFTTFFTTFLVPSKYLYSKPALLASLHRTRTITDLVVTPVPLYFLLFRLLNILQEDNVLLLLNPKLGFNNPILPPEFLVLFFIHLLILHTVAVYRCCVAEGLGSANYPFSPDFNDKLNILLFKPARLGKRALGSVTLLRNGLRIYTFLLSMVAILLRTMGSFERVAGAAVAVMLYELFCVTGRGGDREWHLVFRSVAEWCVVKLLGG